MLLDIRAIVFNFTDASTMNQKNEIYHMQIHKEQYYEYYQYPNL